MWLEKGSSVFQWVTGVLVFTVLFQFWFLWRLTEKYMKAEDI